MASKRESARPQLTTDAELRVRLPAWNTTALLSLGGDAVLEEGTKPTPGQEAAYAHVFERAQQVLDVPSLPGVQHTKVRAELQGVPAKAALGNAIQLRSVHIMSPERDGQAYVGYGFSCSWDYEHGLGVMTHCERVVRVGGGDTAFLTWVATSDIPKALAKKAKTLRPPTRKSAAKSKGQPARSSKLPSKKEKR